VPAKLVNSRKRETLDSVDHPAMETGAQTRA
jgi:hypothetical protein